MQTLHLKQKAAVAGLLMLAGWFLLTSNILPGNDHLPKSKTGNHNASNSVTFGKLVLAKDIKEALAKSSNKKITINIYPIKLSNNASKTDFDLLILYQDAVKGGKILGGSIDVKTFEKQAGWYVKFLKAQGLSKLNVPYGYYLDATYSFTKHTSAIYIEIRAEGANTDAKYCEVPLDGLVPGQEPSEKDSVPPPNCDVWVPESLSPTNSIQGDTTIGRCPPCKILLLDKIMNVIVNKVYTDF